MSFYELAPAAADMAIQYPQIDSEFDVQAAIHRQLRERGIDVRGEVTSRNAAGGRRPMVCRFDLVVFENERPVCVIETKSERKTGTIAGRRQGNRYTRFGVPVLVVVGAAGVLPAVARVNELCWKAA